jgi:hypothetical protein
MATTKSNSGPGALLEQIDALETGTTQNIVGKATVTIATVAMTAAQINAKLGQGDTLYAAVVAARTQLDTAMAAWKAAEPGLRAFVTAYIDVLKGIFGAGNPILKTFGIVIKARSKPSAETTAKAVALRKETHEVRGPTSKKQRAAITTQGTPGLVLVSPTGQPIPGALAGPIPPGQGTPAVVNLVPASANGSSSSGSGAPVPPTGSNGSNGQ